MVFFLENIPATGAAAGAAPGGTLHRYSLKERKPTTFLTGVTGYEVSADGNKLLYRGAGPAPGFAIVDADKGPPAAGNGRLNLAGMRMLVDPRAEYPQMFTESWRFWRDFFYVPNFHGADPEKMKSMYQPWVAHVRHRADMSYLLDVLGGEVAVGHSFVAGGDLPDVPQPATGLLGPDFTVENGRYRISKIYTGESWNPDLRAPLAGPGIDVNVGDYVLAINGAELAGTDDSHIRSRIVNRSRAHSIRPELMV